MGLPRGVFNRFFLYLALLLLTASSGGCADEGRRLLRLKDAKQVSLSEALEDLSTVPFVFVGELHNDPEHHEAQLDVIKALEQAGKPLAIGLEMFRHSNQEELNKWVQGQIGEEEFTGIYYRNWTNPWPLYRDIFLYAREKKIPMIGLNVESEITRQVAREGFASLTDEQIKQLPEVACRIDETYMAFIRRVFGAHAHSEKQFVHFCEAQMVWDTAMAWHLLDYRKKEPARTVVVLAGSGHAWRRGIPAQLRQQSDASYRIILPQLPGQTGTEVATIDDADYLWSGTI